VAEKKVVTAYTDGACLGNPGPGGFGVVLLFNDHRKELSGGFAPTTNNRMELLAVIEALSTLKEPCRVDLYTDSKYVRDAIEKGWLAGWQRKGWMTAGKKPVKNQDLWTRLSPLLEKHEVRFHWVPGHSGVPENERCDALASAAARGAGLPADAGYPA
jgi:ribonuclease HI